MVGVPGETDGLVAEAELFPAVRVLAMGNAFGSGILQHLHRRILGAHGQPSAGLPTDRELRKDKVLPQPLNHRHDQASSSESSFETYGGKSWFSIYSDNYLETELVHLNALANFEEPSPWQKAVREAYERRGVRRSTSKEQVRELRIERLGHYVDGWFGAACTPTKFDLQLISLTWHCLVQRRNSKKVLQILAGRWNRKFQLRRECAMILREFYRGIDKGGREPMLDSVAAELVMALCLMPVMVTDFRLGVSPMVAASDASQTGMAVVRSIGLTGEGLTSLRDFMSADLSDASDQVGLIDLEGGIGSARRALEIL